MKLKIEVKNKMKNKFTIIDKKTVENIISQANIPDNAKRGIMKQSKTLHHEETPELLQEWNSQIRRNKVLSQLQKQINMLEKLKEKSTEEIEKILKK